MAELEKKLAEYSQEQEKIKVVLKDAGVYDKAEIKNSFDSFEKESPKLFDYCKTFYWTLFNYFGAYRTLSTGIVNGKLDITQKDTKVALGLKAVAKLAGQVAQGLPFVGGIVTQIDFLIDSSIKLKGERKLENKVNIITGIIIESSLDDTDLSLRVAKAAVRLTREKKDIILSNKIPDNLTQNAAKGYKSLAGKITEIVNGMKDKVQEVKGLYDTEQKKMALQDVTLFLAGCINNVEFLSAGKF